MCTKNERKPTLTGCFNCSITINRGGSHFSVMCHVKHFQQTRGEKNAIQFKHFSAAWQIHAGHWKGKKTQQNNKKLN